MKKPLTMPEEAQPRKCDIGRHQQATFHPFSASEHYLSSTVRVPLAATASLSRFLICR